MFANLDYLTWCRENKLDELFKIDLKSYGDLTLKRPKSVYETVDPKNTNPFPPELDDLIRLHYLVRSRKVTTILEFGVGKSTHIFVDALQKNKKEFGDFVSKNLRRATPFEIYSIDNSKSWIQKCKKEFNKNTADIVNFFYSDLEMTTFNGRACTMYKKLPNICPDFIYLDAPDQFSVTGDVRGISTRATDRQPMAADILLLEPFLLPGTLIAVDGRNSNARFLKNNFQRNWRYQEFKNEDVNILELIEPPLGYLNEKQIRFCLGDNWPGLSVTL